MIIFLMCVGVFIASISMAIICDGIRYTEYRDYRARGRTQVLFGIIVMILAIVIGWGGLLFFT